MIVYSDKKNLEKWKKCPAPMKKHLFEIMKLGSTLEGALILYLMTGDEKTKKLRMEAVKRYF